MTSERTSIVTASKAPDRLEMERAGEPTTELEREVSTGHTKTRWRTPETTPDTSIQEEQGLPEREQPRAALAPSPTPVLHLGPAGHAGGVGPLDTGKKEEEILVENANSKSRMDHREQQRRLRQWLTPGGLVNIARVKIIDPTWAGTDEPGH